MSLEEATVMTTDPQQGLREGVSAGIADGLHAAPVEAGLVAPADGTAPTQDTRAWTRICPVDDILPNAGVCALVEGRHVAVFRLGLGQFFAIDNIDPKSGASVLSRGLVGNLGDRLVVASPIYKNHFDLTSGECIEAAEHSVKAHDVHVHEGVVFVALG